MRAFPKSLMAMLEVTLEEEGETDEDEKADRDAPTAECVAGLVAGYAREFPDEILEPVFRMIDSASAGRRRRAIRVVEEVMRANDGMFGGGEEGVGMERLRWMLFLNWVLLQTPFNRFVVISLKCYLQLCRNLLEHRLLARLHDDDIHLRKATSWLFANLGNQLTLLHPESCTIIYVNRECRHCNLM